MIKRKQAVWLDVRSQYTLLEAVIVTYVSRGGIAADSFQIMAPLRQCTGSCMSRSHLKLSVSEMESPSVYPGLSPMFPVSVTDLPIHPLVQAGSQKSFHRTQFVFSPSPGSVIRSLN